MPTIVEDGNDDEDFQMIEEAPKEKKGRGRKAGNVKNTTTTTRKRGVGAQSKPVLSQKLITNVLKPVDNVSPEKKLRKMRASPFNKKSSSVLGRVGSSSVGSADSGGSSSSSDNLLAEEFNEVELNEASAVSNRPKRGNRAKVMVIESDSEEIEEEQSADDSDFVEDDD